MRKIFIDLTSLLDVVLILLFVAINGSAAKYENATASAQQAQSEYEQLIVDKSEEYETLISDKQSEYDKMLEDGKAEIDEKIKEQDEFLNVLTGEYDKASAEKKAAESIVKSYGFVGQKIGMITVAFVKPEKTGTAMITMTVNGDVSGVKTYVIASENELKNYVTMWTNEALSSFAEKNYDIVFIVYEFDYENITITQNEIIDGVLSGKAEGKTVYYKIKK